MPLLIAVQHFADMRHGLFFERTDLISIDLALYTTTALVLLPYAIGSLKTISKPMKTIIWVFLVFIGYGLISVVVEKKIMLLGVTIPKIYAAMPLIMATLVMLATLNIVATTPAAFRIRQMWWSAVVLVISSYLMWPVRAQEVGSPRFTSGFGGAAVIYMALLLAAAIFLASIVTNYHRQWSIFGLVLAVFGIIASGSRGGMVALTGYLVILVVGQLRKNHQLPRRFWPTIVGAGVIFTAVMMLVPEVRRVFSFSDRLRTNNLASSLTAWQESWQVMFFGRGVGQFWTWYAFEASYLPTLPRQVPNKWGMALPHSHSTLLFALVEMGIFGLLILLALLWLVAKNLSWAYRESKAAFVIIAAIVATIPGLLFDTYLVKNFPIAFWWWFVLISVVGYRTWFPARKTSPGPSFEPSPQPSPTGGGRKDDPTVGRKDDPHRGREKKGIPLFQSF